MRRLQLGQLRLRGFPLCARRRAERPPGSANVSHRSAHSLKFVASSDSCQSVPSRSIERYSAPFGATIDAACPNAWAWNEPPGLAGFHQKALAVRAKRHRGGFHDGVVRLAIQHAVNDCRRLCLAPLDRFLKTANGDGAVGGLGSAVKVCHGFPLLGNA